MRRSSRLFSILFSVILLAGFAAAQGSKRDEGIELFRAQDFAGAATKLEEATAADKDDRQAWLFLAASYKHLDRDKEAQKAFKSSWSTQKSEMPTYEKNVKIIKKPMPKANSIAYGTESYKVAVELRADATVGVVIPFSVNPGNNLNTAIYAAKTIEFEPAVQNGKPVTIIRVFEYTYTKY